MKTQLLTVISLLAIGTAIARADQTLPQKMNGKLKVTTLSPEEIRYTGKPYIKELGAYAFNCRNYDPVLARWTTPDPSGFPDGANNQAYAPIPTNALDPIGLNSEPIYQSFNLTPIGQVAAWNGTFIWSLEHGSETAKIDPDPAGSGFDGVHSWKVKIGDIGVGADLVATYLNRSNLESYTNNTTGVTRHRYIVDMEVDFYLDEYYIVQILHKDEGSCKKYIKGNWYE